MSLTLELSEPLLRRLQAEAAKEQRTPESLAYDLIAEGLTPDAGMPGAIEEGSLEEAEAIREGWADYAAGRFKTEAEVREAFRRKYDLDF